MSKAFVKIAALACALGLAAPAAGQGQAVFPPVPGPFVALPVMPGPVPVPPVAMAPAPIRPLFQPPVNAIRVPYWMQQAPAGQMPPPTAAAPAPSAADDSTGATTATTGYGQATAPGTFPEIGSQAPAPGYAAPGVAQGFGGGGAVAPQGWGYGAPPGWAPTPYAPQPGWGGWAQPAPGN
jgi:hypothetical protein